MKGLQHRAANLGGWLALLLGTASIAAAAPPPPPGGGELDRPRTWRNHHSDLSAAIQSGNIDQLRPAWKVKAEGHVSHDPLLHDGSVFFADWSGSVYKVDAHSGELIWKRKIAQPKTQWPWYGFAGVGAIGEGLLFEASAEGTAYALDLQDGSVVWQTDFTEDPHAGNVGHLLSYDGLVYIGVQSVEEILHKKKPNFQPNFQGKVVALDASTGNVVWELPLVEAPQNGAGVWSAFAVDPQTGTLFFTTSNNYTGRPSETSDAIFAVDAYSGDVRWFRQLTEHDVWTKAHQYGPDYAFGAGPQLFEATIDGRSRRLVGAGQKSGIYWALDRRTGEIVWSNVVGYGGIGGGIHAEAAIGDGWIYVWSNNHYNYGKPPEKFPMKIKALDAATGQNEWVIPKAQPAAVPAAGFLAADVYLVGSLDGKIRAYRAADGRKLWTSPDAGGAISTSLIVDSGMLFFGTGIPKKHGGRPGGANAMVAYTLWQ